MRKRPLRIVFCFVLSLLLRESPGTRSAEASLTGFARRNRPDQSARRPALWALAHALLHEFAMACLPVRHPSFDGELLAFLERSGRRGGFALSRRSRNGEADRQDGRNRQRHDTHHILRDYLWRPRRPPSPR